MAGSSPAMTASNANSPYQEYESITFDSGSAAVSWTPTLQIASPSGLDRGLRAGGFGGDRGRSGQARHVPRRTVVAQANTIARNASKSRRAKILAVLISDKGQELVLPPTCSRKTQRDQAERRVVAAVAFALLR
jgi:hypothetical protein